MPTRAAWWAAAEPSVPASQHAALRLQQDPLVKQAGTHTCTLRLPLPPGLQHTLHGQQGCRCTGGQALKLLPARVAAAAHPAQLHSLAGTDTAARVPCLLQRTVLVPPGSLPHPHASRGSAHGGQLHHRWVLPEVGAVCSAARQSMSGDQQPDTPRCSGACTVQQWCGAACHSEVAMRWCVRSTRVL